MRPPGHPSFTIPNRRGQGCGQALDKAASDLANEVLGNEKEGVLERLQAVYVADISGMPSLVTKMFALPAMRALPFPIGLARESAVLADLPRQKAAVTVIRLADGKVQGIDYSAVSVEKARKVNARAIAAGRCTVQQASVAELPFEAEQFDVVTAFETVYFWPELAQNFREVYRVLKPGGIFFICNEANGETTKDDKWTQIIDGMTIYTDTALKEYLEKAGFCQIQSHKNKKGWLCITAQK